VPSSVENCGLGGTTSLARQEAGWLWRAIQNPYLFEKYGYFAISADTLSEFKKQ
jgi:hypothetical protein